MVEQKTNEESAKSPNDKALYNLLNTLKITLDSETQKNLSATIESLITTAEKSELQVTSNQIIDLMMVQISEKSQDLGSKIKKAVGIALHISKKDLESMSNVVQDEIKRNNLKKQIETKENKGSKLLYEERKQLKNIREAGKSSEIIKEIFDDVKNLTSKILKVKLDPNTEKNLNDAIKSIVNSLDVSCSEEISKRIVDCITVEISENLKGVGSKIKKTFGIPISIPEKDLEAMISVAKDQINGINLKTQTDTNLASSNKNVESLFLVAKDEQLKNLGKSLKDIPNQIPISYTQNSSHSNLQK